MAEADEVLRVEKMGPMLADWVPVLLGHHRVVVKPVVNPSAVAPSDSYEIGNRMREVVLSRNPVEGFPGSKRDARGCDLDHTIPWQPGAGLTRPDNLAPLSRFVHRAKTHGGWQYHQAFPGTCLWQSPLGYIYLTTPERSWQLTSPLAQVA